MVCFLSSVQGPVQAKIRPAMWVPGVKLVHSHREKWDCPNALPAVCVEELIKAVDRVQSLETTNGTFRVTEVDRESYRVQIFNWTWAEWLDVVEIEFKHGQERGTEAECLSFSSGFLPTWFPLCFVFNSIICFLPFWDKHFNRDRLRSLRSGMQIACRLKEEDKEMRDPLI